jgi:hypothetical protein
MRQRAVVERADLELALSQHLERRTRFFEDTDGFSRAAGVDESSAAAAKGPRPQHTGPLGHDAIEVLQCLLRLSRGRLLLATNEEQVELPALSPARGKEFRCGDAQSRGQDLGGANRRAGAPCLEETNEAFREVRPSELGLG